MLPQITADGFICRKWFVANGQSLQGLVAFPNGNPINSSRWPFCSGHWFLVIGLVQPNSITTPNVSHKHTKSLLQSVPTRHFKRKCLNLVLCSFHSLWAAAHFLCLMLSCLNIFLFFVLLLFYKCSYMLITVYNNLLITFWSHKPSIFQIFRWFEES